MTQDIIILLAVLTAPDLMLFPTGMIMNYETF